MFLNIFDDRTYQFPSVSANQLRDILQKIQDLLDLNAIPVNKRHHFCYVRGLIFDLVFLFFNHYSFSNSDHFDDEIDGYRNVLIPFFVHIGWHILHYKRAALCCGYDHTYNKSQIEEQILSTVLCYPEIKKEFARQVSAD
jgi:hypothetical protein